MKDMLSCPPCVPPGGGQAALCGSSEFPASSKEDCDDERASPAQQTVIAEVPSLQNEVQVHICQSLMTIWQRAENSNSWCEKAT